MVHFPERKNVTSDFLMETNMAQEDFRIKIGDFGFSREITGMVESYCGTPLNMAPEILEKKLYNVKADIWSLGVILFELITGFPPFKANTKSELKANIK